jgi:glutamate carboxypeptidase
LVAISAGKKDKSMESTPKNILEHLQGQKEEMVDFLIRLVQAESPSDVPGAQRVVLSVLSDSLSALDYHLELLPGRETGGHLLARPMETAPEKPNQLLLGHCDTVWPLETLEKMPIRLADGRLSGPGVFDMKAGLAQIVYALKAIKDLGLRPAIPPVVFINSDEEIGSAESTPHIITLAKTASRAFILEPALGPSGKLKTARKGVGQFSITVHGKSAHAGLDPERGVSAILELSHQIQRFYALADPVRGVSINVGKVQGGLRPNVVAPESKAVVDVRILNEADAKTVTTSIFDLEPVTTGITLKIEGGFGRPPLERTDRNRALWTMAQQVGRSMELALEEGLAGGGSDGNTTSQYTATLDGLGPVGDGAHALHEFVYIDHMIERCALLALLILAPPHEAS